MQFKFHDIEQNTDEWFAMRGGLVTSSKLGVIMANFGKAFGAPAKKYARDIAVEQITGKPISSNLTSHHLDRGHEEEPLARMAYENQFFCDVSNGGFFESQNVGCSPDGLIGNNGVLEIKSAIPSIHFDRINKGSFDSSYKWQLVGNVKFTDRDWIDFVSYCSQFPDGKKLYTCRLNKDDHKDDFDMIDERLESFIKLVSESKEVILNSNYVINQ